MAQAAGNTPATLSIAQRVEALDWNNAAQALSERGCAVTAPILSPAECHSLATLFNNASRFRSHIVMERYRFGIGDYKYFANPLPEIITNLRTSIYPHLAEVANHWAEVSGESTPPYPREHTGFLKICHQAGQTKPTPLMLRYEAGGFNCLHQDLWRRQFSPATGFPARPARTRLGRRRIRPRRAATPRAVQAAGGPCRSRTGHYLRHALPAREGFAWLLSRQSTARRQPGTSRCAHDPGHHLPRRRVAARPCACPNSHSRSQFRAPASSILPGVPA
jgi:hypothetical protein